MTLFLFIWKVFIWLLATLILNVFSVVLFLTQLRVRVKNRQKCGYFGVMDQIYSLMRLFDQLKVIQVVASVKKKSRC